MNFTCASLWKQNYAPLALITTPNKAKYAAKHGYKTYFVLVPDDVDIMFVKIEVILAAMKELAIGDWVWFSDCDSVVTNHSAKLEVLAAIAEDDNGPGPAGILIADDFNGLNSGSMLVRKDPRTIDYLCWVLAQAGRVNCEQAAMQETVNGPSHWNGLIKVVRQKLLNSYDYHLPNIAACGKVTEVVLKEGQWEPGDFLIHFPATSLEKRIELCSKYDREALNGD